MEKEQTRYSRLANITKIINTKLDLREVLQHVTVAISEEIVQCDSVGIFLPYKDGKYKAFAGKPEIQSGQTLESQIIDPAFDSLAKEVIETRKTIYIPDTSKDDRPDPGSIQAFKIKSLLALPISFEQELFGLVFLFDFGVPMNLTESEIQSVEAYVNMAAVAIQNAKNLSQKENLIAQKELLLNVTRDLSKCASIDESFDKCFYYLEKVLSTNRVAAHLLDPSKKKSIRLTRRSKACDWDEKKWEASLNFKESYEALVQKVILNKEILFIPTEEKPDLLMIPMTSMGEVLGVITVIGSKENSRAYEESQIQMAQSIVDATAPTFSNLLYMDELENMVAERTSELAAANERVTSVIESIPDGFFALNQEWQFTYINKHQYLPRGKKAEEVMGQNIWKAFPETMNTVMYEELQRAMHERIPVTFEIHSPAVDYWHEVVAYPYDDGICCLFKNVSEKKKYEKELKRLANLELIGQMAAGISHEIRNPMTTVRGFLQLLEMEEGLEKHREHFKLMVEELDRANAIITEFLSVGNTRTSELQMLDLNALIQDIAPLIRIDTFSQDKLIEFKLQNIPELLLNRNEIRQLIMNLYRNGLEAMDSGKVLTIGTYTEGDNCVVLAVRDEGGGIKTEVLEKLGTPFYTTKDNGTGLGLGICYAIAARHNAKIEIATSRRGTTFFVKFYS